MSETLVDLGNVTGGCNMAVLAASPGDESLYCGGLIAEAAARGRPPFVAVLTDGSLVSLPGLEDFGPVTEDLRALRHGREGVAAAAALGVPAEWFVVLGLHDGTVPTSGTRFESVVAGLSNLLWRRDCNAIAVPWAADQRPNYAAAHAVGAALARRDGIGLVAYRTLSGSSAAKPLRLSPGRGYGRRAAAIAAHSHLRADFDEAYDLVG